MTSNELKIKELIKDLEVSMNIKFAHQGARINGATTMYFPKESYIEGCRWEDKFNKVPMADAIKAIMDHLGMKVTDPVPEQPSKIVLAPKGVTDTLGPYQCNIPLHPSNKI